MNCTFFRAKELREAVSAPLAKYFVEHLSDLIKESKSTIFTTCVLNSLDSKVCESQITTDIEENRLYFIHQDICRDAAIISSLITNCMFYLHIKMDCYAL